MSKKDERGFWLNAKGEAVHPANVKAVDKIKDELVESILAKAKTVQENIIDFKDGAYKDVEDYFSLLLQEYGMDVKSKSKKGNITLENFSGTLKVQIARAEKLGFDEKLKVAKLKIDDYLEDVTKDSSADVQTLINKAFEVDKEGNIDSKKIFALREYEISDKRWKEAMEIIDDSKHVVAITPYIRFYKRNSIEDKWELVKLDIAGV